jgi:hypothetical protein
MHTATTCGRFPQEHERFKIAMPPFDGSTDSYVSPLDALRVPWAMFPLHPIEPGPDGPRCGCGNPSCKDVGKHPALKWSEVKAGEKSRHPDYHSRECDCGACPNRETFGFGIATGERSGLVVVDIDETKCPGALARWEAFCGGECPLTYTVQTGSGGWHFYFEWPGFSVGNSGGAIGEGIDIRGDGGYVVAPGSPHKSGGRYDAPIFADLAPLPPALLEWFNAHAKPTKSKASGGVSSDPRPQRANAIDIDPDNEPSLLRAIPQVERERRATNYLANVEPEVKPGGDGSSQLIHVAGAVVRAFACGIDGGVRVLSNVPVGVGRSTKELRKKCCDAMEGERFVWGSKLIDPAILEFSVEDADQAQASMPGAGVTAASAPHEKARIQINAELDRVVDEAARALGNDPNVFKRAGELVRIVRVDACDADEAHREGTPQIRPFPMASLKVQLTRVASWLKKVEDKKAKEGEPRWKEVATTPGDDVVAAVSQMGEWSRVPRLESVIETPAMRPDGTILQIPGYDRATAFYYEPGGVIFSPVPEHPTQEQAHAALEVLLEPFLDFPFATGAAYMVPVAAVLTLLARPAIRGNVPAFVFEAATRGSGKTMLADVVAMITTGRIASKVTFPRSEEELEKILGGYARKGVSLFSFDNVSVDNPFGGAPLDKVLTSGGSVDLRILGKTETPTFEWRALVLASGNNVAFKGDTTRRVLVCRLESPLENPEDRADFLHPDLLGWVAEERARLAVAGLTVLRGYVTAGRPGVNVKPWGSFESWAGLVPRAIVWACGHGDADPQLARPTLDTSSEPEKTLLERLLLAFPSGEWRVRDLIDPQHPELLLNHDLQAVLEEMVPSTEKTRPQILGKALEAWKGRVVGGQRLARGQEKKTKVATWRVERVST